MQIVYHLIHVRDYWIRVCGRPHDRSEASDMSGASNMSGASDMSGTSDDTDTTMTDVHPFCGVLGIFGPNLVMYRTYCLGILQAETRNCY